MKTKKYEVTLKTLTPSEKIRRIQTKICVDQINDFGCNPEYYIKMDCSKEYISDIIEII